VSKEIERYPLVEEDKRECRKFFDGIPSCAVSGAGCAAIFILPSLQPKFPVAAQKSYRLF
jgi:hypothetical protein